MRPPPARQAHVPLLSPESSRTADAARTSPRLAAVRHPPKPRGERVALETRIDPRRFERRRLPAVAPLLVRGRRLTVVREGREPARAGARRGPHRRSRRTPTALDPYSARLRPESVARPWPASGRRAQGALAKWGGWAKWPGQGLSAGRVAAKIRRPSPRGASRLRAGADGVNHGARTVRGRILARAPGGRAAPASTASRLRSTAR
jgi:hypothetical protein